MARIAVAGFQHETNTFGATRAAFADFEMADAWPGMLRGSEVISGVQGANLPMAGFARAARRDSSVCLLPIVWCSAEPSSYVTDDAFERISGMILGGVREAGALDGIYLDLHGAMATESHQDGEGELLSRLRALVGDELPIAVSLDLHANVTRAMTELASSISIFRTYPHLDMAETGARAFRALMRVVRGGRRPRVAWRRSPFLVPLHAQCTGAAPCAELYATVARMGSAPESWAELAMGFPAADIYDCGPSVCAYAETRAAADLAADELLAALTAAEGDFDCALLSPEESVAKARKIAAAAGRPAVIADVQDNSGAGGSSDTTGLLRALVLGGAKGAVLGMLNDPEIAARAHALGAGEIFAGELGGKTPVSAPFGGRFVVEALSDGEFPFTGEMYAGCVAETGPTALLRVADERSEVRVVVGSKRCQCLDKAVFTHLGVNLSAQSIIAVKSSVHFRADYEPIAAAVLSVKSPGLNPCCLDEIPYQRLRPGVRIGPRGRVREA